MARHSKLEVLNAMHSIGVVPVFYNGDIENAQNIARACVAGGIRVLEFTNRGDHAWEVFSSLDRFCAAELPDAILGAGISSRCRNCVDLHQQRSQLHRRPGNQSRRCKGLQPPQGSIHTRLRHRL